MHSLSLPFVPFFAACLSLSIVNDLDLSSPEHVLHPGECAYINASVVGDLPLQITSYSRESNLSTVSVCVFWQESLT